ncbi:hypothetical protein RhiirA4_541707 [Rhizophagus irregularis]|uniref:BTB domain-containing protein n=1 Tax=Rhizophagus irregularis TaxID=588596 RepID=A0A2I1GCA3_9GLOM|nr:hypothetical protein RhiirA4_541707 [Rhizophagus irregularis]
MASKLSNVLHKEYNTILESTEFYDTEILVGEYPYTETFKLHSLILKIRSPYFRAALSNSIYIAVILIFPKNNIKTNVKLLIAADELILQQNFLNLKNYPVSIKKPSEEISLIFKASDLINIKEDTFLYLLEKNDHSLRSIEIWDRLMEWCIAQSSELLLSDASNWTPSEIEIIEITPSEFCKKIKPFKGIFDNNFYVKILEYYSFNYHKRDPFSLSYEEEEEDDDDDVDDREMTDQY